MISFWISDYWQEQVMNTGRISDRAKARYLSAIQPYRDPKAGAYITDKIAILLEKGWGRFDMKPGLLKGLRWRVIPLRIAGQVQFRTVSENSKGWIHPGYGGAHVMHRVEREVPKIVQRILQKALK